MTMKPRIPKNISLPTPTAWWVCGELNSRRKAAKQRETDLIKTRKKLNDDLDQFGSRKCAERTRVCELLVDTERAIEAARNETKWLADQMQDAFDHANQPAFWDDEEQLAAMLGEPPTKAEPIDELIAAAADVQVVPEAAAADARSAPKASADGKRAEIGEPEASHAARLGTPAQFKRGDQVRVMAKETGELEACGVVHTMHEAYALVTVGGKQRRYAFDAYALEAIEGVAGMVSGEIHESKPAKRGKGKQSGKKPAAA